MSFAQPGHCVGTANQALINKTAKRLTNGDAALSDAGILGNRSLRRTLHNRNPSFSKESDQVVSLFTVISDDWKTVCYYYPLIMRETASKQIRRRFSAPPLIIFTSMVAMAMIRTKFLTLKLKS